MRPALSGLPDNQELFSFSACTSSLSPSRSSSCSSAFMPCCSVPPIASINSLAYSGSHWVPLPSSRIRSA